MSIEENVPPIVPAPYPQPMPSVPVTIGKFKASRMIVGESWKILKQDKELLWFPVFSAITSLLALIAMGILFFFIAMGSDIYAFENAKEDLLNVMGYVIIFIYYLVMFFIANYYLAGIYIIAHGRFSGQDLSLKDGMAGANRNIGKIFIWSLISATIGVILQMIANRFKFVGRIVAAILGATWTVLTYFSLPSLVIGQRSVSESFKESAAIIRKTWGETIIVNFGVGLFFGIIMFLGWVITLGIIALVPVFEVIILVLILFMIFIITITIISNTLSAIFKLALYEYALTGTVPQGFTPDLVRGAIKTSK